LVQKSYQWKGGAILQEHSRRKHKILREYFARYLEVRCQLPHQARFRLAVIDGFAGGGRYEDGSPGSPVIFVEELRQAAEQFNIKRQSEGMSPLDIECFLALNDENEDAFEALKGNIEPLLAAVKTDGLRLHPEIQ
jgi:three-Cys-motif partner protein